MNDVLVYFLVTLWVIFSVIFTFVVAVTAGLLIAKPLTKKDRAYFPGKTQFFDLTTQ